MENNADLRARLSAEWVNGPEWEEVGTHSIQLTGTRDDLVVLFAEIGLALHERLGEPLEFLAIAVLKAEMLKAAHGECTNIDMAAIKRAMDATGRE